MTKSYRRWLSVAVLFLAGLLVVACLAIAFSGLREQPTPADLAVVLGNKVRPDGKPSQALKARLDHAVELYRQGYFKLVLVSGAHGKEGYNEPKVMRRYLEAHAIPHESIFEDNEGFNTWMTAQNTAGFLQEHHLRSVLIVSQYFHLPRCRLAFAKFDVGAVSASAPFYFSIRDFWSLPREVAGYVVYTLRPVST